VARPAWRAAARGAAGRRGARFALCAADRARAPARGLTHAHEVWPAWPPVAQGRAEAAAQDGAEARRAQHGGSQALARQGQAAGEPWQGGTAVGSLAAWPCTLCCTSGCTLASRVAAEALISWPAPAPRAGRRGPRQRRRGGGRRAAGGQRRGPPGLAAARDHPRAARDHRRADQGADGLCCAQGQGAGGAGRGGAGAALSVLRNALLRVPSPPVRAAPDPLLGPRGRLRRVRGVCKAARPPQLCDAPRRAADGRRGAVPRGRHAGAQAADSLGPTRRAAAEDPQDAQDAVQRQEAAARARRRQRWGRAPTARGHTAG
jgi:hypothetical protein